MKKAILIITLIIGMGLNAQTVDSWWTIGTEFSIDVSYESKGEPYLTIRQRQPQYSYLEIYNVTRVNSVEDVEEFFAEMEEAISVKVLDGTPVGRFRVYDKFVTVEGITFYKKVVKKRIPKIKNRILKAMNSVKN